MNHTSRSLAVLALTVLCLSPVVDPAAAQQAAPTAVASERTQTFKVDNMSCALCPITVGKAIGRVAGVKSVTADLDSRTATVVFDPGVASLADIAAAARDAGYPATPVGDGG